MVGERIRQLRKQKGWTQKQLAARTGLSQSTISDIETGKTTLGIRALVKIAKALGVSVSELRDN